MLQLVTDRKSLLRRLQTNYLNEEFSIKTVSFTSTDRLSHHSSAELVVDCQLNSNRLAGCQGDRLSNFTGWYTKTTPTF